MARKSKGPWWWEERGQYAVNVRGKRHLLGTNEREARKLWHQLESKPEEKPITSESLLWLLDEFLDWVKQHRPDSASWYSQRIVAFANTVPDLVIHELKPLHVQKWIDTKKSDGHRRGCLIAVNRAMNWAVKQGHIERNPIRRMEKPRAGRREIVIEPETYEKIRSLCSDQAFHDLLTFTWETGCRPQEAYRLDARYLDAANRRCIFPVEESKGKKRKRIIYLNDVALKIAQGRSGRIFLNEDGEPWHRNHVACRFARIRGAMGREILKARGELPTAEEIAAVTVSAERRTRSGKMVVRTNSERRKIARNEVIRRKIETLVPKYCLYNFRHSYCQRALKNGVDPITLAELMGHASAAMIMKVYQHIHQDASHLQAAASKAAR